MKHVLEINDWLLPEELAVQGIPILVLYYETDALKGDRTATSFATVALEHSSAVRFLKLNLDENPSVMKDRGLTALPTIVLYRDGVELARRAGPMGDKAITELIVRREKKR